MTGMALAHCILGKFLGVVCHCFPPPLDVPTFAARCLYVRNDARDPSSERWNCGRESCPVILPKFRLPHKFRDLLHAANLRHGTDGYIYIYIYICIYIYNDINSVRQHNCFYYTRQPRRLHVSTIEQSSSGPLFTVKSQDAVHTLGSQCVYISEILKHIL